MYAALIGGARAEQRFGGAALFQRASCAALIRGARAEAR